MNFIPQSKLDTLPRITFGAFLPAFVLCLTTNAAHADIALEEVIVTAQKREESLQDIPISITALRADDLVNRSLSSTTEIYMHVPGLEYTSGNHGGGNANFYIRGIGQTDFISTLDPGVGVYIDGVYVARTVGGGFDLLDIERIEVLRGPQGTLYGKNTIGGAVSVVTKKPSHEPEGELRFRMGERSRINSNASINVPLIDNVLAARLSLTDKNQDGYGRSAFDGKDRSDENTTSGRATFLWDALENVEVIVSGDFTHTRQAAKHAIALATNPSSNITTPQNAFAVANGIDPYDERYAVGNNIFVSNAGFQPGNELDVWGVNSTVTWDITDNITLKSITAYRNLESVTGLDFDASPGALSDQDNVDDQEQFSQEFLLSGIALEEKLSWVAGLYYMDEDGLSDILLRLSFAENPAGLDTRTTNKFSNQNYALFSQVDYQLTEQLSATAGIRYNIDEKENTIRNFATKFGIDLVPSTTSDDDWGSLTYRLGLEYNLTPDTLTYFTLSTGFKSGGFNGRAFSIGEFSSFEPEEVKTYELGIKTSLFDNIARVSAAGFYSSYTDIQTRVNVIDPVTQTPVNVVQNAAEADIYGVEMEALVVLSDAIKINLGATYTHAEYADLDPGVAISEDGELPQVPSWTFNAGIEFNPSLPSMLAEDGELLFRLDYSYKDDFYQNAQNSPYNFQSGYDLLNLRIGYGPNDGSWQASVYALNLLDEEYMLFQSDLLNFTVATAVPGAPREVGIELNYRW